MENKDYFKSLFNENMARFQNSSLDEVILHSYESFKNDILSNKIEDSQKLSENFDLFRTTLLNSNNIDEYAFYTQNVDKRLVNYIEKNIFPEYSKNDKAHGILHIKEVIRRSFALNETLGLGLDDNLIYTIASFHDLGKYLGHEIHEKIAASKFFEDEWMKSYFDEETRELIKEAIEDHRSSFKDIPRSDYGKLISSADRNTRIEMVFIRSFFVGQWRTPEMKIDEFLDFTFNRLSKRYSEEDPENMFYEDQTYINFLSEMRELLKSEKEFKNRYIQINHIKSLNDTLADYIENKAGKYKY